MELNEDYNSKSTIYVWMEINGSSIGIYSTYFHVRVAAGRCYVQFSNDFGIFVLHDIATINGNEIFWTFPTINISNLILSIKTIPEWRILARSLGDYAAITYANLIPNFNKTSKNEILGYSLLIIGLISIISLLINIKRVQKPKSK